MDGFVEDFDFTWSAMNETWVEYTLCPMCGLPIFDCTLETLGHNVYVNEILARMDDKHRVELFEVLFTFDSEEKKIREGDLVKWPVVSEYPFVDTLSNIEEFIGKIDFDTLPPRKRAILMNFKVLKEIITKEKHEERINTIQDIAGEFRSINTHY